MFSAFSIQSECNQNCSQSIVSPFFDIKFRLMLVVIGKCFSFHRLKSQTDRERERRRKRNRDRNKETKTGGDRDRDIERRRETERGSETDRQTD